MANVTIIENTGLPRFYSDIDDVQFVQSGDCDYCDHDYDKELCKGCFNHYGRGDGVLVLIKDGKAYMTYDADEYEECEIND